MLHTFLRKQHKITKSQLVIRLLEEEADILHIFLWKQHNITPVKGPGGARGLLAGQWA